MSETLAIAGSGTIACGLAAVGAVGGDVLLWARSEESRERAERTATRQLEKLAEAHGTPPAGKIQIVSALEALGEATVLVEAVSEDLAVKSEVLRGLAASAAPNALLATTTSSLCVDALGRASGRPGRFFGLHVFNPVARMELIELVFGAETETDARERAQALCTQLGKTAVTVPNTPGFVVNRLLFPYLFDAVELMASNAMAPADVDRCMVLGCGMPMGPIALLDFIGLDVAQAIGEEIGVRVPEAIAQRVRAGALGRKAGQGFYTYD